MTRSIKQLLLCRWRLLEFIKNVRPPGQQYIVGRHTRAISARIDQAIEDYRRRQSSYLVITVPFRHGKSEIVSRHLPPFFLGNFRDSEVMLASYSQSLAAALSRDARNIVKSGEYRKIFPAVRLANDTASVGLWGLANSRGKFQAATINSGSTGKGADLLIIDDYLSGRADAESATIRDKQWDNFTGNLLTRLAPVHIVIILATPWHHDDLIGRIKDRVTPGSENYDDKFPPFEINKFPARDDRGHYLFPERFDRLWYEKQFAALGAYQAAALLQCEPTIRGGNMLKTDKVKIVEQAPDIRYARFWDLASTAAERGKADPDWTVGALVGVRKNRGGVCQIFVKDVVMCQSEAPDRNRLIVETAAGDGHGVQIGVESVAGYKDSFSILKALLKGRSVVKKITVSSDKVTRAAILEPALEAGEFYLKKAYWNKQVLEQLQSFPAGAHDDIVDAISGAAAMTQHYAVSRPRLITV